MSSIRTRVTAVIAGVVMTSAVGLAVAPASFADTPWNNCGEDNCLQALRLFYNSNLQGSQADFEADVSSYAGYEFRPGAGAGSGQSVKNNAASAQDESGGWAYQIFYDSDYKGPSQTVNPYIDNGSDGNGYGWANLDSTLKNNNASQKWVYVG
ncbi:hypothetical protein K7472_27035 [Streptomyces sp. PTM05]|uniref:Peptidase inhibitor family I36 n=1 Tax=Streptantibioticus parmotrematis TaxID=2873249 RepID=A0ABS7R0L8_9ACTN|nr:hypothetical protein [Streptantibioticus parmotrematis]MBY8888469.1 hypothetical protein [Streptantibioticus parmotrematis]